MIEAIVGDDLPPPHARQEMSETKTLHPCGNPARSRALSDQSPLLQALFAYAR